MKTGRTDVKDLEEMQTTVRVLRALNEKMAAPDFTLDKLESTIAFVLNAEAGVGGEDKPFLEAFAGVVAEGLRTLRLLLSLSK